MTTKFTEELKLQGFKLPLRVSTGECTDASGSDRSGARVEDADGCPVVDFDTGYVSIDAARWLARAFVEQ